MAVFFPLNTHQRRGMGEDSLVRHLLQTASVWFTLLCLQLALLTIFETGGRLTGAAVRPGRRKTSWSPSGSRSPAEIWGNDKQPDQFQTSLFLFDFILSVLHETSCYADRELTASSACPTQRKAHSCLQWSRRFHSFGDPFPKKQRQTAL